jgi:hypothetical protein
MPSHTDHNDDLLTAILKRLDRLEHDIAALESRPATHAMDYNSATIDPVDRMLAIDASDGSINTYVTSVGWTKITG